MMRTMHPATRVGGCEHRNPSHWENSECDEDRKDNGAENLLHTRRQIDETVLKPDGGETSQETYITPTRDAPHWYITSGTLHLNVWVQSKEHVGPNSEISTMKKTTLIVVSLLCVLLCASAAIFAGTMPKIADHQSITFDKPMFLAGTELPAGTYSIQHQMQGDDHYMIFRQTDVSKAKAVEVTVKCSLVSLTAKANRTESRYVHNAKNQNVLTELTFKGDEAKHVFEAPAL